MANVWEALQSRLSFAFDNYPSIVVSFSGGKDSGVLLNAVLKFKRDNARNNRVLVFHQDFEAQYAKTTEFVERMFQRAIECQCEPLWVCLPIASRCAVSNYQMYWHPWDASKSDIWVRPMPSHDWVIRESNNPFDFYRWGMPQEDFYRSLGGWASRVYGKSIVLVGIRTQESLNRFRAVYSQWKESVDGKRKWTTLVDDNQAIGHPLYDWKTEDVWTANARFGFDYNRLYDLFYRAGLNLSQMRVSSPYHEAAVHSLNMYRVLEPATWVRVVGRVNGANFAAIYGGTKAVGYRNVTLPTGHTWKSYTKFLLATLPRSTRDSYVAKFKKSLAFWHRDGGALSDDFIAEIQNAGYRIKIGGLSNRTRTDKRLVRVIGPIPDNADNLSLPTEFPSWKRMCYCILKNDHVCKFMGFTQNKAQHDLRNVAIGRLQESSLRRAGGPSREAEG